MTPRNTTCPYCGVGCGVMAKPGQGNVIAVMGDGNHPANAGRLCVKGTALAETLGHEGRLLHPALQGRRIRWDSALDLVAEKLRDARAQYGPESIAFYLSGQLLTEDYYVANKLIKGFLGSANVDTNSRLCMSSAVAAYKRAFGEDIVPCTYTDLETCELLVMVGSNAAWTHPVIYQRIAAAKRDNPDKRVVVVDTRRTPTGDIADLYLQVAPGSDAFLFGGLLNHLAAGGLLNHDYVGRYTEGLDESLAAVARLDPETVVAATGVDPEDLSRFYQWFGDCEQTVTLYSQGVNQSATGTDKCNAIINCHLATGRLGRPGAGPFSITGQPNAMGGREVGGLSDQLAAHMGFRAQHIDRVERFWGATDMARAGGLKAVEMFRAAAEGKIRFLWIMATNPAVSLPDTALVRSALQRCDFVVVSDCCGDTDTARLADLVLPATSWGEKDGTVTNSERVISRQRKLVDAPGEARPDWWMVTRVARRLGLEASFGYRRPADIFREHAALSAFENQGERAFNIGALQHCSDDDYDRLEPVRWPVVRGGVAEPLADGRFFTPSGRARFIAVNPELPETGDGLVINTGRLRDQWHTMTRTGRVPRLSRHRDFFTVSLNPEEARSRGLREGELVQLENPLGSVTGRLSLEPGLPDGQCFAPIHWNEQFTASGRVNALIPAITDPVSGQPQSKYSRATIRSVPVVSWGLLFSREIPGLTGLAYWSLIPVEGGYLTLLAASGEPVGLADRLRSLLAGADTQTISYLDAEEGDVRYIVTRDGHVSAALFLHARQSALPKQSWMAALGVAGLPDPPHTLLAGYDIEVRDAGRMVCSCWEVGERQIAAAVEQGLASVEALGESLRCGTQCGSCVPELKQIISQRSRDCAA